MLINPTRYYQIFQKYITIICVLHINESLSSNLDKYLVYSIGKLKVLFLTLLLFSDYAPVPNENWVKAAQSLFKLSVSHQTLQYLHNVSPLCSVREGGWTRATPAFSGSDWVETNIFEIMLRLGSDLVRFQWTYSVKINKMLFTFLFVARCVWYMWQHMHVR